MNTRPHHTASHPAASTGPRALGFALPPRRRRTDNEVILIVDDSPESLSELGELLLDAGYRVKVANSGHAALHSPRARRSRR